MLQGIAEVSNLGLIAAESLSDASKIVNEVMGDSFLSDAPSIRVQDSTTFTFRVPAPPPRPAAPILSVSSCSSVAGDAAALPTRDQLYKIALPGF